MFPKLVAWMKTNPLTALALAIVLVWATHHVWKHHRALIIVEPIAEGFSTCLRQKQIYLNSCDPDQPSNFADVNIENRFGKMYIKIVAQLPYADGSDFHNSYGAYHAFLVDPVNKQSINIGPLVREGTGFFKLATELLGDYSMYTRMDIFRQTLDYTPKRVLTGSITQQNCSSL